MTMNRTTDAVARFRRVGCAHQSLRDAVGTAHPTTGALVPPRRGGAVLIVVMALLGTLTFLGFLFYTFAAQEQASAEYFATAETPTADFPASLFEDWFLEQLILGTRPSLGDSALYGSNWALVPNMIGRPNFDEQLSLADGGGNFADVNPFDGLGIGVYANASTTTTLGNGEFVFDYDGDGVADADQDGFNALPAFQINFSPAANNGSVGAGVGLFHPDAGYTYPDVNSMFLAFDGLVRDPNNPNNVYRVIIPSFHRPQYIPIMRGISDGADVNGFEGIFESTNLLNPDTTRDKVLRPHQEHVNSVNTTFPRFLTAATNALSGDTTRIIPPFPFRVDINGDGVSNEAGVWSFPDASADPTDPSSTIYEFDVDCDGDGFRDAVWVDLDFPIMDLPDGRQFVPLFACKVIDADALLNVNAHGNMNGVLARQWDGNAISPGDPSTTLVHASNQGLSRSEINLGLGLTADPATDLDPTVTLTEAQEQHEQNFGPTLADATTPLPVTTPVLSNLELLMLLNGRENWRDDPSAGFVVDSQIEGRWGDDFRIADLYAWIRSGGTFPGAPAPGGYLVDDDGDSNMVGYAPVFNLGNPAYPITLPPGFTPDDDINAPVDFVGGVAAGHSGGGSAYRDPHLMGVWIPPFVHPLDYGGTGSGYLYQVSGPTDPFTRRMAGVSGPTNPSQWPTYAGATNSFWQYQYTGWDPTLPGPVGGTNMVNNPFVQDTLAGGFRTLYGVLPYWQGLSVNNELQQANAQLDFLRDDGGEVILNRQYRNPEYDAVFPTHEMEGLHLSRQDFEDVGGTSRLRDLAIINFDKVNEDRRRQIAGRFTTDSWDRLDFSHGHSVNKTEDRGWEFTTWNGGGTFNEFDAVDGTFPPQFSAVAAGSTNDPLRRELRLLLKSEFGSNAHLNTNGNAKRQPRHRLNLNRILSDDDPAPDMTTLYDQNSAFDSDGNPQFRNLTPHPDIASLSIANSGFAGPLTIPQVIHANGAAPLVAFSDLGSAPDGGTNLAIAQEWWARYDRQRLARDIYTLLWVLGGGNDAAPDGYLTAPLRYSPDQVGEMAQFAVNYVDALDRDDAITRFEYDNDLTDGWDAAGGGDLQVVNGVEAQQLTLSEVLWLETFDTGSDEASTIWDDNEIRQYLYIELRNASPFDVEMRTDSWRIARYNAGKTPGVDPPDASFVFKTDPDPTANNGENVVKAGKTYLIGCHDNSSVVTINGTDEIRASDFYVNDGTGPEFDQIIPFRIDGTDPSEPALPMAASKHPAPTLDLDVSYTGSNDHQNRFEFDNPAPINATPPMLNGNTLVSTDTTVDPNFRAAPFTLTLERRPNLRTDGFVGYSNSDWVVIDEFENVTRRGPFDPTDTSGPMPELLSRLSSRERAEPLDRSNVTDHAQTATNPRSHTLGNPDFTANGTVDDANSVDRNQGNSNSPATFAIWQPHFDRDFSSVFELLSIPLFGPEDTTLKLVEDIPAKPMSGWYIRPPSPNPEPSVAMARFLNPFLDLDRNGTRDYDVSGTGGINADDDNRWYRLFEFLTVPDGGDEAIKERLTRLVRTPGKININTVRDEAVLAAILDDAHIQRFNAVAPFQTTDSFDNTVGEVRNWYNELILARDGIDPLNAFAATPVALPLPGVPGVPSDPTSTPPTVQFGAVPYRSMSYVAPDVGTIWPASARVNKLSHNLLRSHVADDPTPGNEFFPNRPTTTGELKDLGIFEARPVTDVGTDAVDYHTRNRLLAKVANHTTNRSNVFAVWLTVGYFEAHQPDPSDPTVVQIGGELAGGPRHRSFFIVDRTRLEEAVEVDDVGTTGLGNTADDIITLNWRSLLLHRRTLPEK